MNEFSDELGGEFSIVLPFTEEEIIGIFVLRMGNFETELIDPILKKLLPEEVWENLPQLKVQMHK